jgi:hypothetical protein
MTNFELTNNINILRYSFLEYLKEATSIEADRKLEAITALLVELTSTKDTYYENS